MTAQTDLFASNTLARRDDPITSHEAAEHVSTFGDNHHRKILAFLKGSAEGGTKDEIAAATGLGDVPVARRMRRLADLKLVTDSGQKRQTPNGRNAIVWRAV